ncbi:transposase [Streptomyces sp. S.PB5]|uniref:RNA-guided endonuclease InsQ/TnpB family protein n=1 Tax=Streptomyces sp. S.PB5 TaxID=3020844 RepID=UPI0025AF3AA0|nr:transposase [Streptomyces sp. S.PB5]MDN3029591.1 transposase [Streptomyces sp. S.PB5]
MRLLCPGVSVAGVGVRVVPLRYAFPLDPAPGQRIALARAFGCARVVYNDAIAARAWAAGEAFLTAAVLSKTLITEAKRTRERHWLGEVSAVALQQSLRDAECAYQNFFASLRGARKGARAGAPRFKSRKDARQAVWFTANARWKINETGRLVLPKIGEVKVRWSRTLPTAPTSVTVVKDAAGRYFASFVIDTDPDQDRAGFSEPAPIVPSASTWAWLSSRGVPPSLSCPTARRPTLRGYWVGTERAERSPTPGGCGGRGRDRLLVRVSQPGAGRAARRCR